MAIRRTSSLTASAAILLAAVAVAVAPPAAASPPRICVPVHLSASGQDEGMDAEGNLHTTATVFYHRLPIATTNATFTPSGPPVGTTLSFSGPIVATPLHRAAPTLTAEVNGAVDLSTGRFTAVSTSVTGTGLLRHASGALTFRGTENLATGAFTETITGRVCG